VDDQADGAQQATIEFVTVGSADDLAEGQMRVVQISGKRVLVTLVEGVPYALGAVCTHERANLDEGTLMGHELYCPLHFSCFDVRTGEALAPPAERATPVYAVKIEDGQLCVSSAPVDPESLSAVALGEGDLDEAAPEAPCDGIEAVPAAPAPATDHGQTGLDSERAAVYPAATGTVHLAASARGTTWHAHLIDRAEQMSGLEAGAQALATGLRPIRESHLGGRLFDLLHGRIMGHALHPALSDLPIGLWFGGVVLAIAGQSTGAVILSIAGIAAGLATAATGVADWTVSDGRDRRLGLLHGVLQTLALVIVAAAAALQLGGAYLVGDLVLAAGLAISMGSAYLGGHLVLGRGVMVDHTAWIRGPRNWTRAISLADLEEGQARVATVEGREILVSLIGGYVSAIENVCSHAGGPLSLGRIENGVVKCPWHGSCFRLRDGAVVKGPAGHPQPRLETRIHDGWVEIRGPRH
jgi:nitrite reductase/ring-hydroxylating ferredoxin subunit